MFTYAIIYANGTDSVFMSENAPDYDTLNKAVGGWLEGVALVGVTAYVNEEGKLKGLPVNALATRLAHRDEAIYPQDTINGDMIVLGPLDDEGDSTSLSDEWIRVNLTSASQLA
jgi:hypothetical protein